MRDCVEQPHMIIEFILGGRWVRKEKVCVCVWGGGGGGGEEGALLPA